MKFGSMRNMYRGYAHSNVAKTNLWFAKFQCTVEPKHFYESIKSVPLVKS